MDFNQILELIGKINFSYEMGNMYNDIYNLKCYLNVLTRIKDKVRKGEIAKAVNITLEPLNQKYGTNFKCGKDEEFVVVLTNMINYIDKKGVQALNKKIEEEIIKKLMNY